MIDKTLQDKLRQKYSPDGSDLRNHQLKCLKILDVVDKICRDNNITYWLGSGTLLGAVRHGGFIPWDDDIDIELLYKDRKRFIKACKEQLPHGFVLQTYKTDSSYYLRTIKVRSLDGDLKENVHLLGEKYPVKYKYNGYFIDIFLEEHSSKWMVSLSRMVLLSISLFKYRYKIGLKTLSVFQGIASIIYSIFRFLSILNPFKKYLYHTYGSYYLSRRKGTEIFPVTEVSFEGRKFLAPNSPHQYLTRMFGDYMKLPDDELQQPSHI